MSPKEGFFDLPAPLLTAVGTVLGFALLGGLDYNQQNSLGNWLMLIAQILETSSAQGQLLAANQQSAASPQSADTAARLEALEQQLKALQSRLEGMDGTAAKSPTPPPTAPTGAEK